MQYIPDYVIDCTYNKEELYVFFPLENEYYNSDNFKNCRKIADKKNFLSKFNYLKACYNKFFENYFTESFLIKYNEMIDIMQSKTHNDFLNTSFKTFDIYSLGITLIFITEKYVNHTINKRHRYEEDYIVDNSKSIYNSYYYEWIYSEKIQEIILKMITPNVFERITIDELLIEFNSYLVLLSS
jgi:serine/threonine protein kinase